MNPFFHGCRLERCHRGARPKEEVSLRASGAPAAEIAQQDRSCSVCQRPQCRPRFPRSDPQAAAAPVDVVQRQPDDLAWPQPVGDLFRARERLDQLRSFMTFQTPKAKEQLYHAIRSLLMEWDPIGIGESPNSHDEYDMYITGIHQMLVRKTSFREVFGFLRWVETERMELPGDKERTKRCAEQLMKLLKEPTAEDA